MLLHTTTWGCKALGVEGFQGLSSVLEMSKGWRLGDVMLRFERRAWDVMRLQART